MRDSIIVDMKYADLDIINGQYGVERHHCLGGPNRKKADEDKDAFDVWYGLLQDLPYEQANLAIGGKTVTDAVTTQRNANGYSFQGA